MTDDQIAALVQETVQEAVNQTVEAVNQTLDALWTAVNDEVDRRLQPLIDVLTLMAGVVDRLDGQAATTEASLVALSAAPPTPPPLGEVVVRLESGPSRLTSRRIDRDKDGNIVAIHEEPADEPVMSTGPARWMPA